MDQNDGITALLRKANELSSFLKRNPDTLAGLKIISAEDRVKYTHKHNSMKQKGGTSPIDFTATELKVDLERALSAHDVPQIAISFYQLNAIIHYW